MRGEEKFAAALQLAVQVEDRGKCPLAAKEHLPTYLPTDIIRGNSMVAASKATRLSAQHLRRATPRL